MPEVRVVRHRRKHPDDPEQGQTVWLQAAFPLVPGSFDPALHFLSNPDALLIGP